MLIGPPASASKRSARGSMDREIDFFKKKKIVKNKKGDGRADQRKLHSQCPTEKVSISIETFQAKKSMSMEF